VRTRLHQKSKERSLSKDRKLTTREEKKRVPKINLTLKHKARKLGHSKSRPVLKLNAEIANKKEAPRLTRYQSQRKVGTQVKIET